MPKKNKLTLAQVIEKVNSIRLDFEQSFHADHEALHADEDSLYEEVLQAIANGTRNAKQIAQEALKTKEIKFRRDCA